MSVEPFQFIMYLIYLIAFIKTFVQCYKSVQVWYSFYYLTTDNDTQVLQNKHTLPLRCLSLSLLWHTRLFTDSTDGILIYVQLLNLFQFFFLYKKLFSVTYYCCICKRLATIWPPSYQWYVVIYVAQHLWLRYSTVYYQFTVDRLERNFIYV